MKSSAEILKKYSDLIREAENIDDFSDTEETNTDDPVAELANYLDQKEGTDYYDLISSFLRMNNYIITPLGGLTNSQGNV